MALFGVPAQGRAAAAAFGAGQHGLSARCADVGRAAAAALRGAPRRRRQQHRARAAALARAAAPLRRLACLAQGT